MLTSLRRGSFFSTSRGYSRCLVCSNTRGRNFFSSTPNDKAASPESEKTTDSQSNEEKVVEDVSSDPYNKAIHELENLENSAKDLHRQLLLKYANAENKRRERLEEVKRRDAQHISKFGEKSLKIYESLGKVCDQAKEKAATGDADEKVKSLAEGLVMTHGIMKNILAKHGLVNSNQ